MGDDNLEVYTESMLSDIRRRRDEETEAESNEPESSRFSKRSSRFDAFSTTSQTQQQTTTTTSLFHTHEQPVRNPFSLKPQKQEQEQPQTLSFNAFSTTSQPQQQTPSFNAFATTSQLQTPSFSAFATTSQPQTPSFNAFATTSQPQQKTPSFNAFATTSQPQQQQTPSFQPQQFQQQQQPQQMYLFTKDNAPASYSTKWADLHPDSQKLLLQIEEKILEHRSESQKLDQCSRLYGSSVSTEGFEFDSSRIIQKLGGINTTMDRQKALLHEHLVVVKTMLRDSEVAVRSFMMLLPRFPHSKQGGGSGSQWSQVCDFYRGIPRKPTVFLQQTVARVEKYLGECRQWVEELEQLLALDSDKYTRRVSLLESLPKVISNVHDFFLHVAAKVENIHQYIESMRTAYLADQRRRGECHDPFLEADRRETAKQEAAAKRVHPTLHLPATTTTTTTTTTLAALPTPNPSSGAGLFLNTTPASAPSTSLFATPSSAAPSSSLSGAATTGFKPW